MNTEIKQPKYAVIYCRVSSAAQVNRGHGLESQETRCREHALANNYHVEAMFPDDVSGGGDFMNRPGMVALLSFLEAQKDKSYTVIFDDLKRFARDTEFHIKLRQALAARGASVYCLNFKFEDTPEGEFIETIMAAQGQLERKQNGRQVVQKMRARLSSGYWVFKAPAGFRFERQAAHGNILVRDEPLASIVQEALEGYAVGRFETQAEVKRYFESQPAFPKNGRGTINQQRVTDILLHPIYAGYITHENWKLNWLKAKHEPLISLATYEAIQNRRAGVAKAPIRKNLNKDFPLRGFVLCNDCQKPLTACWSQGKMKKYAYYLCDSKGCVSYRKSIPRDRMEGEFADILRTLQPTKGLFDIAKAMFKDAWNQRSRQAEAMQVTLKADIKATEKQIDGLLERIMDVSSPTVINAYEAKIEKLERNKRVLAEKLQSGGKSKGRFNDSIEHALTFLANPWKIWNSGKFTLQRTVLRLAFSERISYCRKTGYRTPKTTLPFKVLEGFYKGDSELVRSGGLEPPRVLPHSDLNAARLPIPPRPQCLRLGFGGCVAKP